MPERTYYDPIYNQIVIPQRAQMGAAGKARALLSQVDAGAGNALDEAIEKAMNTKMFDRLSFLYQSGIAWLVFPSATHTRFAHSLGCYHLGMMSLRAIKILQKDEKGGQRSMVLSEWLRVMRPGEGDLPGKNVFFECILLAALLCHDAGHFPFSHTIEMNHEVLLSRSHEEQFFAFLADEFYRSFERITPPYQFPDDYSQRDCFEAALKYLITGKQVDCLPVDSPNYYLLKLNVLRKLVSGLLDLDRIDHYLRDSFFTGVKLANFNIEYLLRGMTFVIPSAPCSGNDFVQRLGRDALIHAKNLLYSKEQLNDAVFENPDLINYELLLNGCIARFANNAPGNLETILDMQDWELLNTLRDFGSQKANEGDMTPKDMFDKILKKESLQSSGVSCPEGSFQVDFNDGGKIEFRYVTDLELIAAIEKFYAFVLGINILSEEVVSFDLIPDSPLRAHVGRYLSHAPAGNLPHS